MTLIILKCFCYTQFMLKLCLSITHDSNLSNVFILSAYAYACAI